MTNGTDARHRWPRAARPRSLVILVLVPVSSIKTSFSGPRSIWPANQASRGSATSTRSCSAARAIFEADLPAIEEAPQGANPDVHAAGGEEPRRSVSEMSGVSAVRARMKMASASMRSTFDIRLAGAA